MQLSRFFNNPLEDNYLVSGRPAHVIETVSEIRVTKIAATSIADSEMAERRGADYGAVVTGRNYTRPISVTESDPMRVRFA